MLYFGTRSFRVAAPTIWNSLPADIRAFHYTVRLRAI